MCVQETRAPAGAALPVDQPYVYDGPQGVHGCEAGFLVNGASSSAPVSLHAASSRLRWRCFAPQSNTTHPILVCSFYAPHVGMPVAVRVNFWHELRASIQEVLRLHPRCQLLLAGDSNVYMGEVMGSARERSCERQLRELIRGICADFQLVIANPFGVPTHRSGSSIDLVLASQTLDVCDVVVHDGSSCGCPESSCCPVLGSDHKVLTFQVKVSAPPVEDASPSWPSVRDWGPSICSLRPRLLAWSEKLLRLRRENPCCTVADRRVMLDILYGEFVSMLWHSCAPTLRPKRVGGRPQPDWWDGECYDAMVGKNAAWRRWCRERTPAAQQALRAKRLHFHHLVRKKKAIFWHTWLQSQEHAAQSNPCIAARNIRRQLGTSRHSVPRCMRSASSECNYVEGEACLEAWRCHFRDVPASAVPGPRESGVDAQDLAPRLRRLREQMACTTGRLDYPFSEPELVQVLQELPLKKAPGPDGLTYEAFKVDDGILRSALLSFFELVRFWAVVPSVWRTAIVKPLHKTGSAEEFTNYRPISLLCCALKIFERLLLKRLLPHVSPQIDESQAGFRWGAEEHVYTLAECLRLRARKRTFCAFVDVRKAFDVAWRDAVKVRLADLGVTGSTWKVLDDLLTDTSARVAVNGSMSQPWSETAGVRQGSVLGPLLFNILFDSISAAVRAACPGVALGGSGSLRLTLLLYADDLVVLAENPRDLQRALDAIEAWGSSWRFSFGIGLEKTAVLVVGCRAPNFHFRLQGADVPVVSEYCYLGVLFQSSRAWSKHGRRLYEKSNRKFHQFLAWAENRQLPTGFRRSLFQSYVLPSMLYGSQFLSAASISFLDTKLRQWGRRLLQWPAGAPGAAVLGELGWVSFAFEVFRAQFGLFGRLSSVHPDGAHRGLAARVFRYALGRQGSWAQQVSTSLCENGIDMPHLWGVSPGCSPRALAVWQRRCMRPALHRNAVAACRNEVAAMPSLRLFAQCHSHMTFCSYVHNSRLQSSVVREWSLARCGHHPFMDGRTARHRSQNLPCLCGDDDWSFLHATRVCPIFASWRDVWLRRCEAAGVHGVEQFADAAFLQLLFTPHDRRNSISLMSAHLSFVAAVCQAQRSLLDGLSV